MSFRDVRVCERITATFGRLRKSWATSLLLDVSLADTPSSSFLAPKLSRTASVFDAFIFSQTLKIILGIIVFPFLAVGQIKIACVGNSITYGYGLSNRNADGYVALIGNRFGGGYDIRNYGVSGRTLLRNGDSPYWNENAFTQVINWQPDIITIMLGTNDTKPWNWDVYGQEFKGDLELMIQQFSSLPSNPDIFLCLPPAIGNNTFQIRSAVLQDEIIPIILTVAREQSLSVIDVNTPFLSQLNLMPDGVHPLEEGNLIMADVFYNAIQNFLTPLGDVPFAPGHLMPWSLLDPGHSQTGRMIYLRNKAGQVYDLKGDLIELKNP